jgi:putative transposase
MRVVRKAYKFRIVPNRTQQAALAVQFGHARFVYNWGLSERKHAYETSGEGLSYTALAKRLPELKAEYAWLHAADSQVLQQKLKDLDQAYRRFFERVKHGAHPAGYPRYKSKHAKQSIRYPQRFRIEGNRLYLPKVGWVKIVVHRDIEGEMKNCTVTKTKSGKYFASIQCEVAIPDVTPDGPEVGIDLGLIDFVTFSDPDEPPEPTPKYLRQSEAKLRKLQKKLARQKQGSHGWQRTKTRIAALHEHIANQRKDFQHKLSTGMTWHYGLIAFENLHIKGLVKNHRLAKSISDAAWAQFVQMCQYKGDWYGCAVEKVGRFFPSSKQCSACGSVHRALKLSDRKWVCPECGCVLHRDQNAAQNILQQALTGRSIRFSCGAQEYKGGADIRPLHDRGTRVET